MNWDDAYRGDAAFEGPPPWNIGEPQPELTDIIRTVEISDDVLDAGCGHAELSLTLAAAGHTVVGIDLSPTAVAAATAAAAERGLNSATFVCADITEFTGYDGRFATIFDSTLFHSLPVDGREGICDRSIARRRRVPATTFWYSPTGRFPPTSRAGRTWSRRRNYAPRCRPTSSSTTSGRHGSTPMHPRAVRWPTWSLSATNQDGPRCPPSCSPPIGQTEIPTVPTHSAWRQPAR